MMGPEPTPNFLKVDQSRTPAWLLGKTDFAAMGNARKEPCHTLCDTTKPALVKAAAKSYIKSSASDLYLRPCVSFFPLKLETSAPKYHHE